MDGVGVRTPDQDAVDGLNLTNGEEVRVGCLWLEEDHPENESVRLSICIEEDMALSTTGVLTLDEVESLGRVCAAWVGRRRAMGVGT